MKEFYETIEERGIEAIVSKWPLSKRQQKLEETSDEELMYYFMIGLTSEQCSSLWSPSIVKKEMMRLPSSDMFSALSTVSYSDYTFFFSPSTICANMEELSEFEFVRCCIDYSREIAYLLESNTISPQTLLRCARRLTVSQLSQLSRFRHMYKPIFQPIFNMVSHCLFPTRNGSRFNGGCSESVRRSAQRASCDGIRNHIMGFLVKK